MSDESNAPAHRKSPARSEAIEDAVVVDETTGTESELKTVHASAAEPVAASVVPVAATAAPADASAGQTSPQVVYVQAPVPPKKIGNRGVGALIVLASGVVFALLLGLAYAIVGVLNGAAFSFGFFGLAEFYIPVLFFVVSFVLLVLIVNRGNWWAYILGSMLVALAVYFGTISLGLLSTGVILNTPAEAAARFAAQLTNPFVITATLLARELSLWVGALISRRGRKLKVRNAAARTAYDREMAEKRAEYDRASTATPTAV